MCCGMVNGYWLDGGNGMTTPLALITGGSRGIGFAIAQHLAQQGYDLVLMARDIIRLKQAKAEILEGCSQCEISVHSVDMGDPEAAYQQTQAILRERGRVDVVFNNAGIVIDGTSELPVTDFQAMQRINVDSVLAVATAATVVMKRQQSGLIINVASLAALRPMHHTGGYSATKAAVVALSQAMYQELLPQGIRVTALCPSIIDTDMTQRYDFDNQQKIPLSDLVHAVDYLLKQSPNATTPVLSIHCRALDMGMPIALKDN